MITIRIGTNVIAHVTRAIGVLLVMASAMLVPLDPVLAAVGFIATGFWWQVITWR